MWWFWIFARRYRCRHVKGEFIEQNLLKRISINISQPWPHLWTKVKNHSSRFQQSNLRTFKLRNNFWLHYLIHPSFHPSFNGLMCVNNINTAINGKLGRQKYVENATNSVLCWLVCGVEIFFLIFLAGFNVFKNGWYLNRTFPFFEKFPRRRGDTKDGGIKANFGIFQIFTFSLESTR